MASPLSTTANLLLGAYVTQLTALGVTLPERQYVGPGVMVAWDADQLVVTLPTLNAGKPGAPSAAQSHPDAITYYAEWRILLLRAVSGLFGGGLAGEMIPNADDLAADGAQAMDDAWALRTATVAIWQAQVLGPIGGGFVVGALTAFGPEGGLSGWAQSLEVSL